MIRFVLPMMLVTGAAQAEAPRVVTDIAPVHALAAQVMDGVGTPELVVPSGTSPHHHAMRPSEARLLGQADLVVWIGPGLAPWLEGPIDSLAGNAAVLELGEVEGLRLLAFREGAMFEAHDHDHGHDEDHEEGHEDGHEDEHEEGHDHDNDEGHDDDHEEEHAGGHEDGHDHAEEHDDHKDAHADEHGEEHAHEEDDHDEHDEAAAGKDPHIWLNPENAILFQQAIAAELAKLDPENAETYATNAEKGAEIIRGAAQDVTATLTPHRGTPFIVLHDAFHYFEDYFELEAVAAISGSDAETPGAARVRDLRAGLPETGLGCAFGEPQAGTRLVETVTEGMDVAIGTIDPLGTALPLGADLYPQMLRDMAASMVACFTR